MPTLHEIGTTEFARFQQKLNGDKGGAFGPNFDPIVNGKDRRQTLLAELTWPANAVSVVDYLRDEYGDADNKMILDPQDPKTAESYTGAIQDSRIYIAGTLVRALRAKLFFLGYPPADVQRLTSSHAALVWLNSDAGIDSWRPRSLLADLRANSPVIIPVVAVARTA